MHIVGDGTICGCCFGLFWVVLCFSVCWCLISCLFMVVLFGLFADWCLWFAFVSLC